MGTKRNIYILAIKRKNKSGERVTLFQRLYYQGEQWQQALNISVPADCYDPEKEIVVNCDICDYANKTINESKQTLQDIFLRYELIEHTLPTIAEVIQEYNRIMSEKGICSNKSAKQKIYITDKIEEFIEDGGKAKSWTEGTKKRFLIFKSIWQEYEKQKGAPVTFDGLKEKDLMGYFDFLCDVKKNTNTTMQKKAGKLRWYLRWCNKKGYYKGELHETFRPKFKGGNFDQHKIIYLTEEELKLLEGKEFTKQQAHLERVRDVFIFACYSGLRYSDVLSLSPNNINEDTIDIVTKKTNDRLSINLNKHTRAILAKYKDWSEVSGKCLPVISNQKTNAYLEELCKLCGIDTPTTQITFIRNERKEICCPKYEFITFHCARRTFITHALRLGMPVPVIMKSAGIFTFNAITKLLRSNTHFQNGGRTKKNYHREQKNRNFSNVLVTSIHNRNTPLYWQVSQRAFSQWEVTVTCMV